LRKNKSTNDAIATIIENMITWMKI
jgi:hypothetical protein